MYKINACVDDISLDQNSICSKCEKQVYDIRNLSKSDINQLVNSSNESICAIAPANKFNIKYYLHPFRRFAFAMILVFGSSVFVMGNELEQSVLKMQNTLFDTPTQNEKEYSISGKILDEDGFPIIGASISLYYKGKMISSAESNLDGEYHLIYPIKTYRKGLSIIITSGGFEGVNEIISTPNANTEKNVTLVKVNYERIVIGEYQKVD